MARQPIFDKNGVVTAYELLFRDGHGKPVGPLTSEQEAAALAQSVVDIGLDKLVGQALAFVNVPVTLLGHPALELLPPERVVVEILEDVEPTQELIDCMIGLREKGYTLALDDFVFDGRLDKLLPHCQIVKVEYPVADKLALKLNVMKLKARGIKVLAEKVEEKKDYRLCQNCGFDRYQGYFFAKPELVPGTAAGADIGLYGQLMSELQNPMVSLVRIEELLSSDARLTHQLLRIASSAAYGGSGVTSLRSALLSVGTSHLVALICLMLMANRCDGRNDLLTLGTIRAKLCEGLANVLGYDCVERHLTVGLLSVLDAVMGLPMGQVVEQIPLSDELSAVLLDFSHPSDLGVVLRTALAIEVGDWKSLEKMNVDVEECGRSYLLAMQWEEDIRTNIAAAA